MDGNGRWAQNRHMPRFMGHREGTKRIKNIIQHAGDSGVKYLSVYAFSTENWKRPKYEVDFLMKLLDRYLKNELSTYQEHGIRFQAIGNISDFSKSLQKRIKKTEELTKDNGNLIQILALNYGGRAEITMAVNTLIKQGKVALSEEDISSALQTPYSDIDVLIRTSGEERISNFLLWQLSYSEFYFTPTLWPDFTAKELDTILNNFTQRNRRFGGL